MTKCGISNIGGNKVNDKKENSMLGMVIITMSLLTITAPIVYMIAIAIQGQEHFLAITYITFVFITYIYFKFIHRPEA